MDPGYASRLVASLEREGLVRVDRAAEDRRVRTARLTPAGRREVREMDRRSDRAAAGLLEALPVPERARLVAAMDEVHRLLRLAGLRIERVSPAPKRPDAASPATSRSWGGGSTRDSTPGPAFRRRIATWFRPAARSWSGSIDGEPVACGAVKTIGRGVGSLKRMWVADDVRGLGIGRRMLEALEAEALALGLEVLRLETNRALGEAIRLYRTAGYREVPRFNDDPYAHHWFEKRLR